MKPPQFIQLEINFSVLKVGTKVQVKGYDGYQFINLTGTVGVVDLYCQKTGDYLIYFPKRNGLVPNSNLILPYKRNQLTIIPGRGRCSWEKNVETHQRKNRSRSSDK
ncbi:MAG: hypothetical protein U7127_31315 (plasmid) [Phormidium sp.]